MCHDSNLALSGHDESDGRLKNLLLVARQNITNVKVGAMRSVHTQYYAA